MTENSFFSRVSNSFRSQTARGGGGFAPFRTGALVKMPQNGDGSHSMGKGLDNTPVPNIFDNSKSLTKTMQNLA